jgi:hypothetical protein
MTIWPKNSHKPWIQELNVGSTLDSIQQVPFINYSNGIVIVWRKFAPPVPECTIYNPGAVFSVMAKDIVVEVAFFVARDGCAEHDDVIGLLSEDDGSSLENELNLHKQTVAIGALLTLRANAVALSSIIPTKF